VVAVAVTLEPQVLLVVHLVLMVELAVAVVDNLAPIEQQQVVAVVVLEAQARTQLLERLQALLLEYCKILLQVELVLKAVLVELDFIQPQHLLIFQAMAVMELTGMVAVVEEEVPILLVPQVLLVAVLEVIFQLVPTQLVMETVAVEQMVLLLLVLLAVMAAVDMFVLPIGLRSRR
jgi:hypothetical protein